MAICISSGKVSISRVGSIAVTERNVKKQIIKSLVFNQNFVIQINWLKLNIKPDPRDTLQFFWGYSSVLESNYTLFESPKYESKVSQLVAF